MKTPICDFVKSYIDSGTARLHMPGHKGISVLGAEPFDITEIGGADVLYSSQGIIRESEANAEALFNTARTVYSAEGSSLSIRAMLFLAMRHALESGKRPLIAAGRNAHKVFVNTAALLDFDIVWIYSKNSESIISCEITADTLEKDLAEMNEKPTAVYITSPDYLGNIADIEGISAVCRRHGILLLVDNAHGAYLQFLPKSQHPISIGADMCADSAHKTLPVLTGGGYLHISKNAPALLCEQSEQAMAMFASTSPSYLILQSLDAANRYLFEGYRKRLCTFTKRLAGFKQKLEDYGYTLVGNEPMKLSLAPKSLGYTGYELANILRGEGIECEFANLDYVVLMPTPELNANILAHIETLLLSVTPRAAIKQKPPCAGAALRAMTPREVMLMPTEEIAASTAVGRILASADIACPPAIPIAVCGEVIDETAVAALEYYGIKVCRVVKE